MVLHANVQQLPGSHFAVVDSGTSMHILQYRFFTSNLSDTEMYLNASDIWGAQQLRTGCLSILMFLAPLAEVTP